MSDLQIERLCRTFSDVTAVGDMTLHVSSGEAVVLLGPSGCGKTTTLRLVAGLEHPDSGSIMVGDTVLVAPGVFVPPERRGMGVVFQSYALWPHKTVFDNVAFGLHVRRRRARPDEADVSTRVRRALGTVRLESMEDRFPHELSGGQQQRVALARVLVTEPRMLLLDEPLSNLDTQLREDMRFEIKRLQRQLGITMIYVTHDRAEALSLADRIVAMKDGYVQQVGPPEELFQLPCNTFVASALGGANFIDGTLVDHADDARVTLDSGHTPVVRHGMDLPAVRPLRVTICLRPSDIELASHPGGEEGTPGRVTETLFQGDEVHYMVDVQGSSSQWKVTTRADQLFQPGDDVRVQIRPGAGSILRPSVNDQPYTQPHREETGEAAHVRR